MKKGVLDSLIIAIIILIGASILSVSVYFLVFNEQEITKIKSENLPQISAKSVENTSDRSKISSSSNLFSQFNLKEKTLSLLKIQKAIFLKLKSKISP